MANFNFKNLDETTRNEMLSELNADIINQVVPISPRLKEGNEQKYIKFLQSAFRSGNEVELAQNIKNSHILKLQELITKKNGEKTLKSVPYNANTFLAESDFNRYYMRAICKIALKCENKVRVYRAKETEEQRETSNQIIGKIIKPNLQLSILNINPKEYWTKKEEMNDIIEYKIARPGSGLSLELIH